MRALLLHSLHAGGEEPPGEECTREDDGAGDHEGRRHAGDEGIARHLADGGGDFGGELGYGERTCRQGLTHSLDDTGRDRGDRIAGRGDLRLDLVAIAQ